MPVPRSSHGPDTINVLRSTSRTPRGKRGILREKDKGGRRGKERSRRINLSDVGGGNKVPCEYGLRNPRTLVVSGGKKALESPEIIICAIIIIIRAIRTMLLMINTEILPAVPSRAAR